MGHVIFSLDEGLGVTHQLTHRLRVDGKTLSKNISIYLLCSINLDLGTFFFGYLYGKLFLNTGIKVFPLT